MDSRHISSIDPLELVDHLTTGNEGVSAKDIVYSAGESTDCVFFVRKGLVKLVSILPNGQSRIVRLHYAPCWLCLERVLNEPCRHTAMAVDELEIHRIGLGEMRALKTASPRTYIQLLEHWFEYLQRADQWITEFSTGTIKSRLARLLSYLGEIEDGTGEGELRLLTGEELAEVLGTTPETVSRHLAELKRREVLSPGHDEQHYRYDGKVIDELAGE